MSFEDSMHPLRNKNASLVYSRDATPTTEAVRSNPSCRLNLLGYLWLWNESC